MHYSDIRNELQTGDMLCWSGSSSFSRAIQTGQRIARFDRYEISHIGMVVRGEDLPGAGRLYNYRLLTFESTTMNEAPDVLTGKAIRGVSFVALTSKMQGYRGRLWVRQLRIEPQPKWSAEYQQGARAMLGDRLMEYAMRVHGTPYERKISQLVASALPLNYGIAGEDGTSLFCSETYVEALESAGIMDESGQDSNAMCPAEVAEIERYGTLRDGYSFGERREITWGRR